MNDQHTDGPWEVWPSLYEGMAAAVVRPSEPIVTVAEVRAYRDAVLIAALPDLLAFAEFAADTSRQSLGNERDFDACDQRGAVWADGYNACMEDMAERARALVAKATGQVTP